MFIGKSSSQPWGYSAKIALILSVREKWRTHPLTYRLTGSHSITNSIQMDVINHIRDNRQAVLQRITQAATAASRSPDSIRLLAVSKTWPADSLREAYEAGQRTFGENYLQEALPKIAALADLPLEWHFIGPLQSNKTRDVATHFDWVHSVDRAKLVKRLAEQRPAELQPLQVCLQVNIDDEDSKSGCRVSELPALVHAVLAEPRLCLRGLMCIPRAGNDVAFTQLAETRQHLIASIPELYSEVFDTLSMGMSGDLEAAIAAGSTMVRVGTALFGARTYPAGNPPKQETH